MYACWSVPAHPWHCPSRLRWRSMRIGRLLLARKPRSVDLTQVAGMGRRQAPPQGRLSCGRRAVCEIRVGDDPLSVTMPRTPGHDHGTRRRLSLHRRPRAAARASPGARRENQTRTRSRPTKNRGTTWAVATLAPEAAPDFDKVLRRHFFAASSCGICGKASIDSCPRARRSRLPIRISGSDPEGSRALVPETLRESQAVFGRTGGLHAAALFDSAGKLLVLREDIGRHNAVDKVIGWALLEDRVPLSEAILMVSGRGRI